MAYQTWKRNPALVDSEEYLGNQTLAREIARQGYQAIIDEYVYIGPAHVAATIERIPGAFELVRGVGVDAGGGVSCISCSLARKPEVERIYCVEVVEDVVSLCQPIVKETVLGAERDKVVSVVGDFDQLQLPDRSVDFAVSWDSMHHSAAPVRTLRELRRVLKPGGAFIIVDRAHNNATPDSEIERMLNIVYDEAFLIRNHRPRDMVLTRRANGEREYRYSEWESFFRDAGFSLQASVVLKTDNADNRSFHNDNRLEEVFLDYNLGGFGHRKVAFLLRAPLD